MNAYRQSINPKKYSSHKCESCENEYTSKANLEAHVKKFHQKIKDHHECAICGREFGRKTALNKHILKIHKNLWRSKILDQ